MIAQRPESGWRATALAAALFSTAADPEGTPGKAPTTAAQHDCCLGLAQAPAIAAPPIVFVAIEPVATPIPPLPSTERITPAAIRDGPTRPRGPPSFV